jgi:hypothetical protein
MGEESPAVLSQRPPTVANITPALRLRGWRTAGRRSGAVAASLALLVAMAGCSDDSTGEAGRSLGAMAGAIPTTTTTTTTTTTSTTTTSTTTTTTTTTTAPPPPTTAPTTAPPVTVAPTPAAPAADKLERASGPVCVVSLHGKGGFGSPPANDGSATLVAPTGNADGWGGRQWVYASSTQYSAARAIVVAAIDGSKCGRVILYGFSNGAAFAAKLYCRGETFGDRLVGVVVDDPVTDHSVEGCRPAGGVQLKLYWTGALEPPAVAGWPCASGDWTCQGDTTIGIASYASALGTRATPSPHGDHEPYSDAPELTRWR